MYGFLPTLQACSTFFLHFCRYNNLFIRFCSPFGNLRFVYTVYEQKNEVIWKKVYSTFAMTEQKWTSKTLMLDVLVHFERLLDLFRYALSSLIMLGSSTSGQQNVTLSLDTHIRMMHLSQKWNCKLYILSTISLNSEVLVTGPSTIMQRGHRIQPRWSAITSVIASTPLYR